VEQDQADPDRWGGGNPTLGVAENGTLYGAFFGSSTMTPAPAGGSNFIVVMKTTDRGKTFTATEAAAPSPYYGPLLMNVGPGPTKSGTVHVVYEHKIGPTAGQSDRDIFYQRSIDGAKTFSEPTRINDDDPKNLEPGGGHVRTNPNITVAPNGRVDAVWWDFRDDTGGFTNDGYYAYSNDNVVTWSKNIRSATARSTAGSASGATATTCGRLRASRRPTGSPSSPGTTPAIPSRSAMARTCSAASCSSRPWAMVGRLVPATSSLPSAVSPWSGWACSSSASLPEAVPLPLRSEARRPRRHCPPISRSPGIRTRVVGRPRVRKTAPPTPTALTKDG
jgi:hypothetical protein